MRHNPFMMMTILLVILLAVDFYVFKGLKVLTAGMAKTTVQRSIFIGYWLISLIIIGWVILAFFSTSSGSYNYRFFFYLIGAVILLLVPKLIFSVFHLVEDIIVLVMKLTQSNDAPAAEGERISRMTFLSQTGLVLAAIPLVSIGYGILKGRFDFRVLKETITFKGLPKAFDGLKVVQISDIHVGSFFNNYSAVQKGIDMVNDLEPDLILFTGDLVNNYASEMDGWVKVFGQLKAKYGKYSILGNHDYGDYVAWESEQAKAENMEKLYQIHEDMGFTLLRNDNAWIEKDGERFPVVGVENWGLPPFPQHGRLDHALRGVEHAPFKLLMSHDPSHWDAEVLKKTNIDLTLSGHTHGSQFGVEIAGWKWSPVKYKYPRWGGLYTEQNRHLYVNRGFGYLAFPGRVGMPPEITLLELKSGATA